MLSPDISLQDLEIFVEICRLESLKEASRQMGLSASVLSKATKRLEEKFGFKLFTRTQLGMQKTAEGAELYRTARRMMALVPNLSSGTHERQRPSKPKKVFSVGSISFLSTHLVAPAVAELSRHQGSGVRFRLAEFSHNQMVALGLAGNFEMAVHIEPLTWTRAWHTVEIGDFQWGLFGRYGHPLGTLCRENQVLEFPFVVPTGWHEKDGYLDGKDNCPLSVSERIRGNEATTAETAAEIVRSCDELTFIPDISAQGHLRSKQIQRIHVQEWPAVKRAVYLSVRSDRIQRKQFEQIHSALKSQLARSI